MKIGEMKVIQESVGRGRNADNLMWNSKEICWDGKIISNNLSKTSRNKTSRCCSMIGGIRGLWHEER